MAVAVVRSLPSKSDIDTDDLRKHLGSIVGEFAKVFVTTSLSSVLPTLVLVEPGSRASPRTPVR